MEAKAFVFKKISNHRTENFFNIHLVKSLDTNNLNIKIQKNAINPISPQFFNPKLQNILLS